MSKKRKTNIILIALAIASAIIVYSVFFTDKATAPETSVNFESTKTEVTQTPQTKYQDSQTQVEAAVLMYHHVGPLPANADNIRKGLTVSTEEFESQIKYLVERKYKFLTLSELNEAIINKKIPEKVVTLTFDDGYDDNFSEGWPVMKKYGVNGTFFLIVNKLGTSEYMSRDQAIELYKGKNEIGSHSMTHPSLDKLKGAPLEKEVKSSKEELEKLISGKVISFCYPAGKYNDDTIRAVSDAGYKMAVTTQSSTGEISSDKLLEIPRYRISSSMSFESRFR